MAVKLAFIGVEYVCSLSMRAPEFFHAAEDWRGGQEFLGLCGQRCYFYMAD